MLLSRCIDVGGVWSRNYGNVHLMASVKHNHGSAAAGWVEVAEENSGLISYHTEKQLKLEITAV